MCENFRSDKVEVRRSAATLLCAFCSQTRADYSQYVPQLLRGLIHLFADQNKEVLQMSWEALSAVTKTLEPAQQLEHVSDIRQAVRFTVSDLKGQQLLPGFCLPKGTDPNLNTRIFSIYNICNKLSSNCFKLIIFTYSNYRENTSCCNIEN